MSSIITSQSVSSQSPFFQQARPVSGHAPSPIAPPASTCEVSPVGHQSPVTIHRPSREYLPGPGRRQLREQEVVQRGRQAARHRARGPRDARQRGKLEREHAHQQHEDGEGGEQQQRAAHRLWRRRVSSVTSHQSSVISHQSFAREAKSGDAHSHRGGFTHSRTLAAFSRRLSRSVASTSLARTVTRSQSDWGGGGRMAARNS